jgi:fibronectin-binding autotransporter adhesin
MALLCALSANALAQAIPIGTLQTSGTVGAPCTVDGVITQVLSMPGAVNGIGGTGGAGVVYTYAFYVNDGTGGLDVYGALPPGSTYVPTVGDTVKVTGNYAPFHQLPEITPDTSITKTGTASVPAPSVLTIGYIDQDIAYNSQTNTSSGTAGSVLPNDLAGIMVTLNNVKITGAGTPGTLFGTSNSPGGANVTSGSDSMTFYYWPSSYSLANTNIAKTVIPSGYVNMTGSVSVYGNGSNIPEFNPISITPSQGPPVYWQPSSGSSTWDGFTPVWSTSSGAQVNLTGDASSSAATFDDTGLLNGSTVNVGGGTLGASAYTIVVSNSAGTYNFTGGTASAEQLSKNGAGTLLINNTIVAPVSVTAGTLGGKGTIVGPVTVGSGATLTPGSTVSTVGQLTVSEGTNSVVTVDFSGGGTYLWKLGSSLVDSSSGTAGTSWDVLNLAPSGSLNFSGNAQLALSFAGTASPSAGNAFWNSNHTWVISSSAGVAPAVGGSIVNGSYAAGAFSLQGDFTNDLVLKFTSTAYQPRNLLWSASGSSGISDGNGTWSSATWTDSSGTAPGLSFDSTRPDNATFGNPSGTGGTAAVAVSGAVTAGSLTFNGGNSAKYSLTENSSSVLTINNGITALASATLGSLTTPALGNGKVYLGYSQTWDVASGTLLVDERKGIFQSTVSNLAKTGSGILDLACAANYTGGTTLSGGEIYMGGNNFLPQTGVVTTAAATLFELHGTNETIGGLGGSGSIDLGGSPGSIGVLTFGDATNQTFSGVITGSGGLVYAGLGTSILSGSNTFIGSVAINGANLTPGELLVSADANLGNPSNGLTIDNANLLGATASFSSSRTVTMGPFNGTLDVVGSGTVLTINGQVTCGTAGGALIVNNPNPIPNAPGPGMLVLTNSTNNYSGTTVSSGTLSIASPGCVGTGAITFLGLSNGGSSLQFASSMTFPNDMYIPVIGKQAIAFDTENNYVTFTGNIIPPPGQYYSVAIEKTGSGTLNLAPPIPGNNSTTGTVYVDQGTLILSTAPYHYSAINNGNVVVTAGTGGAAGATLRLANVQLGVPADLVSNAFAVGYVDLSSGTGGNLASGATLLGSGTSSYANGDIEARLNYSASNTVNGRGLAAPYSPGFVTIATVSASDVLSIQNSVKQDDPGNSDINNNGGNAIPNPNRLNNFISDPNKVVTIHVAGPGRVQLQEGGANSSSTFGGNWSVDSGVLEVGPYQTSNDYWSGPQGQLLNALGFKTVNGQTYSGKGSVQGDPDIPNSVTVNAGGMFVVAVDQVNVNPYITSPSNPTSSSGTTANNTPDYLRNPIILNGGTLAVSGTEADFSGASGFDVSATSIAVTARLGGDFTVSPGTSTIATYDPIGGTGARTVQLLGGSRMLSNSTYAFAAGTVLTYNTTWAGTLNIDGGTAGGQFKLLRDSGGSVSVASGASIRILHGATVLVGDIDPNSENVPGAVPDPNGALYGSGNWVNFTAGAGGGSLVFSRTSADVTYGGNAGGDLSLTQEGSTSLILGGSNSYTGGTFVDSGTLVVNDTAALPDQGSLSVGAGAAALFGPVSASAPAAGPGASVEAVPEPGSVALVLVFACGGAGIWLRRWRRACQSAVESHTISASY